MTKKYITESTMGPITEIFAVKYKGELMNYKNKPGTWFSISLSDKTGQINAKFWGRDDNITNSVIESFSQGDVVRVIGEVKSYNKELEIHIDPQSGSITKLDTNTIQFTDFIPSTKKDIEKMKSELIDIVSHITNPHLKELLKKFTDDQTMLQKIATAPAAKQWHHNFVGGLLEHILTLIEISKTVHASHPELDLDLLILGCILHDIGKTEEFQIGATIEISTKGRLLGHIAIGFLMVAEKIREIQNFPEDLKLRVFHVILSHHGKLENGSPIIPMTTESVAFSMIDDTDAKSQHAIQIVEKTDKEWKHEKEPSGYWFYTGKSKK